MNSLSLDAVVTEICREMDSEENAFAGDTTLATATFLASASKGERIPIYGGIFFDSKYISTKIPHTHSCSSSLRSEFILCEAHTMYPYSIFVVNQL